MNRLNHPHPGRWILARLVAACLLGAAASPALAQEPTDPQPAPDEAAAAPNEPTAAPEADEAQPTEPEGEVVEVEASLAEDAAVRNLKIVAHEVEGIVQVQPGEGAEWSVIKPGQELTAGATFRTGLRGRLVLLVEPDQLVTIERLTRASIGRAEQDGRKIHVDIFLYQGRAGYKSNVLNDRFKVEEAGIEHESTISAPGATLALRGCDGWMDYDPILGVRTEVYESDSATLERSGRRLAEFETGEIGPGDESAGDGALNRTQRQRLAGYDATERRVSLHAPGRTPPGSSLDRVIEGRRFESRPLDHSGGGSSYNPPPPS